MEEAADLIDFVAMCRTYASELAINEVTLRTYSDLQHYVEQSTELRLVPVAAQREKGARLPAAAGEGGGPLLRSAVRHGLRVIDEPGGGERRDR